MLTLAKLMVNAAVDVPVEGGFEEITLTLYPVPLAVLAGIVPEIERAPVEVLLKVPKETGVEPNVPDASESWAV